MKKKYWYGKLVAKMRNQQKIVLRKLAEGITSSSELARIEKGERFPERLLRERLLGRLGTSGDNYENYMNTDDYKLHVVRRDIIRSIDGKNIEVAKELLEKYKKNMNQEDSLTGQFYFTMLAQIMIYENCSNSDIADTLKVAVSLTVPDFATIDIKDKILSIQELNLILEYLKYSCAADGSSESIRYTLKQYNKLLEYMESRRFDKASMSKLYPKIIYYICHHMNEYKEDNIHRDIESAERKEELCAKGIEILSDYNKMYYLCELMEIHTDALKELYNKAVSEKAQGKAVKFKVLLDERREYKTVLSDIYNEYGADKYMQNYCYLYQEPEVYCIGDIIRIRREMLNMSRTELCDRVCAEKTLKEIENKQTNPRLYIIADIFEKLKMPGIYESNDIATDNIEDLELLHEMSYYINEREYEKATALVRQLKESLDMSIPVNVQYLSRIEGLIAYETEKIELQEYIGIMKKAIEYTLPFEAIFRKKEVYMTNLETECLYDIMIKLPTDDVCKKQYIDILRGIYEEHEKNHCIRTFIVMYELIMSYVASYLGNIGKYDESDEKNRIVLHECLKARRMFIIPKNIYSIHWNNEQRVIEGLREKNSSEAITYLNRSLALSRLSKQPFLEKFYIKKLENYEV